MPLSELLAEGIPGPEGQMYPVTQPAAGPDIDWGTVGKRSLTALPVILAALALRKKLPWRKLARPAHKWVSKDTIRRGLSTSKDVGLLKDATGRIVERPFARTGRWLPRRTPIMKGAEIDRLFLGKKPFGSLREGVKVTDESITEAVKAARKSGLGLKDVKLFRYEGIQEGEGMRLHLFTYDNPGHLLHGTTIAGDILKPLKALRIRFPKSKKVTIIRAKPDELLHADIYARLPADMQKGVIESGYIEGGKFTPK